MPPDDPLGRHGPSLDNFLRKRPLVSEPNRPLCPYGTTQPETDTECSVLILYLLCTERLVARPPRKMCYSFMFYLFKRLNLEGFHVNSFILLSHCLLPNYIRQCWLSLWPTDERPRICSYTYVMTGLTVETLLVYLGEKYGKENKMEIF